MPEGDSLAQIGNLSRVRYSKAASSMTPRPRDVCTVHVLAINPSFRVVSRELAGTRSNTLKSVGMIVIKVQGELRLEIGATIGTQLAMRWKFVRLF